MLKTHYKYIHFVPIPTPKTQPPRYSCRNTKCGDELGTVAYFPSWSQYVYAPSVQAIYSEGCLRDIRDFVSQCERERKGET